MSDDENHTGRFEAEFRRQMRSGQMRRFVENLPFYTAEPRSQDRFARLLHSIDQAVEQQTTRDALPVRRQ